MAQFDELKGQIKGEVILDETARAEVRSDFGRMVDRMPGAVVYPATEEDVATVLRFAAARNVPVATRGEAHTQSGQSTTDGGIVLKLEWLNAVDAPDTEAMTVGVQAGLPWRDLVEELAPRELAPPVLTNNLGVTIGGTLSMAGLGVASFRYGAQIHNVTDLTVVTGAGEIVRCSPEENAELFHCALGGLGQFGVITRATLSVRRFLPRVRKYFLLYDDLATLMRDAATVMGEDRIDYIESWCVPCPQGFKKVDGQPVTFAEWFFPLHLTREFAPGQEPDDDAVLQGLSHYRKCHVEDGPTLEFYNRLDPLFELWRRSGYWDNTHPWMENVLPWDTAANYINQVLANLPPAALGGGHVLLWPAKGRTQTRPMFKHPETEYVMGFGILPGVPPKFVDLAREKLNMASDLGSMCGGKRYLSGLVEFDQERWRNHYDETWPKMQEWKKKYDPHGVLNPGFILYE